MGLRNRSLVAEGADGVHGKDAFLDNDDLRPLKLKDRTWDQWTYFTFWFSATATVYVHHTLFSWVTSWFETSHAWVAGPLR